MSRPAARVWLRGARRHPGRGGLVVATIALMAVAVVSALVAADSLETVFLADAAAEWGDIDVVVHPLGAEVMDAGLAGLAGAEGGAAARAWAPRLVLRGTASAGGSTEPYVRLLGVTTQEQMFGRAPAAGTGMTEPAELGPGEVVVNERLAERLGIGLGDELSLVVAVPEVVERDTDGVIEDVTEAHSVAWSPTVAAVVADAGLADLGRSANVLTRLDALQGMSGLEGKVSGIYAAAAGGDDDAAEALVESYDGIAGRTGLAATAVGIDARAVADEESGQFRGILLALALLVLLAAVAVVVNLLVLLGEERAGELASLRALGVRRGVARGLLTAEGMAYALVGVAIGLPFAIPLGDVLAGTLAEHFASIELGRGRETFVPVLEVRPTTVLIGAGVVLGTALATARAAARRVVRGELDLALRGEPGPAEGPGGTRRPLVLWTAGALFLGMGLTAGGGADLLRFLGLTLIGVAWWVRTRRSSDDRHTLDRRAAAVGVVWCTVAPALLGDFARGEGGVESAFGLLTLAGAGAVTCGAVLTAASTRGLSRFIRGYLPNGRAQAPLRLAGAYAEGRTRTTALTATVAIVLFMSATLAVLGRATAVDPARQSGGFSAIGSSVAPVDVDRLRAVDGAATVVAVPHTTVPETAFRVDDEDAAVVGTVPYPINAVRVAPDLTAAQAFGLASAAPGVDSAADALEQVLPDRDQVVLDRRSRPDGAVPGDIVVIDDGRNEHEFELVAVLDTFVLNAVLLGPDAYDRLFASDGPTFVLAAAAEGADPAAVAARLGEAAADRGLVTRTIPEAAAEVVRVNRSFTDVFVLLLQIALAVALVGVGATAARTVAARRAEIGMLRSLGLRRRTVVASLVGEPLLAAVAGVLIGTVLGLAVLRLLFAIGLRGWAFVVDVPQLGLTALAVLVLVALVATLPSRRGPVLDPAVGLRHLT